MADDCTSLSIVKELHRLAQNPAHREYLLRNDVNSVLTFGDPDEHPIEIVSEAIHALYCLAEEASESQLAKRSMRNTMGLIDLMKKIEHREGYSIECKALAIKIQQLISNRNVQSPLTPKLDSVVTRAAGTRTSHRTLKFLGGNKKAKMITLQIDGLVNQERRQLCLDELVRVKGVISLTFNMAMKRCIIRAKADLSPETLANAIRRTNVMKASQVVKNECGEEVMLSFKNKVNDSLDKSLPAYLDEDALPVKKDHVVARPNSGSFGAVAGSWFGSVLTAVNKNLYW